MTATLVAIDLQPAFCDPASPWFTPSSAAIMAPVASLVARFGERAVFTRFVPPAEPAGSWIAYYQKWPFALDPAMARLWALEPRWGPRDTVDAPTMSKWGPALRRRCEPGPVVLCGLTTECCVLMTALAASDDGAEVRVVADACAAKSPSLGAAALAVLSCRAPQVEIVTLAEELARLP